MRDAERLQLKSKLLVGAAGMTAAAMSTAAFAADAAPPPAADTSATPAPVAAPAATPAQAMTPIDPPKWLPYVDIGGGVGSGFAIGRANAFVPVWQDLDSLMFVRFGADTGRRNSDNDFNLGAGYRAKIDSEWILGAFAGFDSTQTEFNHTFNQFSLGLEAMSADWDIRANAYFAKKTNRAIGNKFALYIHDTTIAILQGQEAGMSGFDGEVGYRVFNTDSTDVRVFAGAYTFHHADVNTAGIGTNFTFPYRDVTGPKLRAEVNVFDLDMLGSQSRFSVEGQVSHDSVNHTSEYIGATLRIALDDPSGPGAQALDDLDRRMADPVRRNDNVLTQWHFNKPEPVIIYNGAVTSKPTNTLYYAEQRSSAGAGTYADQTTIQDATSRGGAGKNAFIVLTDAGGSTIDATGTTVQSGETVTGAGTFKVRGANNTYPVFTHDFAPGSGAVSLSASTGNVLNINGDANIAGLSIVGPFVDGIYGANVGNVTIANVSITGPGTNGIVFQQTDASGTSNIVIDNSSITGVSNDGIELGISATSGATSTTNLIGSNLTINAGNDGVSVTSNSTGTSNATVYAGIHDSTLIAGGTGAQMVGTTSGGGTLTQTLLVDPTTIHASTHGIYVGANISSGTLIQNLVVDDVAITGNVGIDLTGTATGGALTQTVQINNTTIDAATYGLRVEGYAKGGSVSQSLTATGGAITGDVDIYGYANGGALTQSVSAENITTAANLLPISINAYGEKGSIDQTVSLTNVIANGSTYDNIDIYASGYGDVTVHQTVSLSNVQASNAGYSGIEIDASAGAGATTIQTVGITGLTASNNYTSGVQAQISAYSSTTDAPSVAAQYLTIDHATLTGNTYTGVSAGVVGVENATARQDVNVLNSTVTGSLEGIVLDAFALNGGSAQQNIYFANDSITHNTNNGIEIINEAKYGAGFSAQYGSIDNVDVSYNGRDGIRVIAGAHEADAEQQLYMVGITADHEGRDGVEIAATATGYSTGSYTTYPSHVEQDLYVVYSDLSHNARNGLEITDTAADRAQIDQTVFVYGSHMDNNVIYGFYMEADAQGPATATYANGYKTVLNSTLYIENSTADHNGLSGAYIYSAASGATTLTEKLTVEGSDFSNNGDAGLVDVAYATGYLSENLHYVSISGSTFASNSTDGADLIASQVYGPGPYGVSIQIDTISDSDFSQNAGDGLYLGAFAHGNNGRAESYVTISGSTFSHNGENGIDSLAYAGGGGYVPGYSCQTVQGTVGYCAVVRERLYVDGSSITDNAKSGIYLGSAANDYGAIYSHSGRSPAKSLYVSNSTISGNPLAGIAIYNYVERGSYQFQYDVIDNTKITNNGTDGSYFPTVHGGEMLEGGVSIYNEIKYGSAQRQFVNVEGGSDISDNKGMGVSLMTNGFENYGLFNLLTVYDSKVDGNYGGVLMTTFASQIAGGVTQVFYSVDSHFDDNIGGSTPSSPFKYAGAGVQETMLAFNVLGNAYQYFGSIGSTFSGNEASGAAANQFAKYVGTQIQTVASSGDTFENNAKYGLNIDLITGHNTSVYDSQSVTVTGDTLNGNAFAGLGDRVSVKYGSYLHQTVSVADTVMDHNIDEGFSSETYVSDSSLLMQNIKLYSYHATSSASDNGTGVSINGSAETGGTLVSYTYVQGVVLSDNAAQGLHIVSYGESGATSVGKYYVDGNTLTGNTTGVYLHSAGGGDVQLNYLTNNTITGNTNFGVFGYAANNSVQDVHIYTGGNTVTGNGTDYSFGTDGTATQNVN